jgi:hypothetical protein
LYVDEAQRPFHPLPTVASLIFFLHACEAAAAALLVNDGTSNSVVFIRNDLVYFASRSYTSPTNVVRGLIVGSGTAVVSPLTHEADVDMDPLWLSTPEYFTFNSGNETNVQGWFFKHVLITTTLFWRWS